VAEKASRDLETNRKNLAWKQKKTEKLFDTDLYLPFYMLFILWLLDIVLHTQIQNIGSVIKITFGFYQFCEPEIYPVHHTETGNFQTLFFVFFNTMKWSNTMRYKKYLLQLQMTDL
jgi:hypothetical protein